MTLFSCCITFSVSSFPERHTCPATRRLGRDRTEAPPSHAGVAQPDATSGRLCRGVSVAHGGCAPFRAKGRVARPLDRKSTRLNSSHSQISYAVFCVKKKRLGL